MTARRPSTRRRLLLMLMPMILVVWLVVTVLVHRAARHEVQEVFDADLARSARILQAMLRHEVDEEQETAVKVRAVLDELGAEGMRRYPRLAAMLDEYLAEEERERLQPVSDAQQAGRRNGSGLIFIARYADGGVMLRDSAAPDMPPTAAGYRDLTLAGDAWRIYSLADSKTGLTVQVGERHALRDELVAYITRNTTMPLLLALPVLGLLIWAVVGRALAPLQRAAQEVTRRAPDALEPIDDRGSPREVQGLLQALNRLFARLRAALDRERQFTADAAHELRTPLAALKTHLQVARAQSGETATRRSLAQALAGVDRATHTLEQLLSMARADAAGANALGASETDLRALAIAVVSALSQQAVERDIDLGIDAPRPALVHGDPAALQVMLRNLVDNAVRYTPAGGSVTVEVGEREDARWLAVRDDGPGVADAEHDRIFERFQRGRGGQSADAGGSGLGLSIVRRIAEQHGARVEVGRGLGGRGLGVAVSFPRARDAGAAQAAD